MSNPPPPSIRGFDLHRYRPYFPAQGDQPAGYVPQGPVWIEGVRFTPHGGGDGPWAEVQYVLHNRDAEKQFVNLDISVAGGRKRIETYGVAPGTSFLRLRLAEFDQAEAWTPEAPELFLLWAKLEMRARPQETVDDWRDRVGFRDLAWRDGQCYLNGRLVAFRDEPADFRVLPDADGDARAVWEPRVAALREASSAALRLRPGALDVRLLDLCDAYGLPVLPASAADLPSAYCNHPSVVLPPVY